MSDTEDNIRLCEYRRYGTSGEWRPVQRDTKIAELLQRAEKAEARVKKLEDKNLRDETRLEMVLNLLTSGRYDKAIKRLKHWGYEVGKEQFYKENA